MRKLSGIIARPLGLRLRLALAVLMIASPLAATMIVLMLDTQDLLRLRMVERIEASARATRSEMTEWLQDSGRRLQAVADRIDLEATGPTCSTTLSGLVNVLGVLSLSVADLDGDVRCSSRGEPGIIYIGDRDFFRAAKSAPGPQASAPIRSRISGQLTLPVAMAVRGPDGTHSAVVSLGIDLQAILAREEARHGFPGSTLTVWGADGEILARAPDGERLTGSPPGADTVHDALAALGGVAGRFQAAAPDGKTKTFVAEPIELPRSRLWLTAEIPSATLYAGVGLPLDAAVGICLAMLAASVVMAAGWGELSLCRPLRALALALRGEERVEAAQRVCEATSITELARIGEALGGIARQRAAAGQSF